MMKLITWEMDRTHAPADPTERIKLTMALGAMVKKHMDSGQMKIWGMNPGGNHGFSVTDTDEKTTFAMIAQSIPHVKFKVEPMLSIDAVIETVKKMQPGK